MESRREFGSEFDSLEATELSLAPPGTSSKSPNKRPLLGLESKTEKLHDDKDGQEGMPTAKAQVVGWPPVRSFRRNNFQQQQQQSKKGEDSPPVDLPALFIKVSMDGAPYLRKIDLNLYQGYKDLRHALDDMFKCFSTASDCVIAYEDKDGDWMLAGDVPWGMFTSSCKRLRIMKGNDARGLGSNPGRIHTQRSFI